VSGEKESKFKKFGRLAVKTSPFGLAAGALHGKKGENVDQSGTAQDTVSDQQVAHEVDPARQVATVTAPVGEESEEVIEGLDEPGQADALQSYKVVYRGGHPDYPKRKASGLFLGIYPDHFQIEPTKAAKKWFRELSIPYAQVRDVQIVARTVSSAEGLLGGVNSRQLNQDNNIHIIFEAGGMEIVLRLEMLTGVTVMAQAGKCREFEDRLRNLGVRQKFQAAVEAQPASGGDDIPGQIAKLAALRDDGILSDEEFQNKKAELLKRL
jgi:hypothetical protein